jgi:hypothetical protein
MAFDVVQKGPDLRVRRLQFEGAGKQGNRIRLAALTQADPRQVELTPPVTDLQSRTLPPRIEVTMVS